MEERMQASNKQGFKEKETKKTGKQVSVMQASGDKVKTSKLTADGSSELKQARKQKATASVQASTKALAFILA